MDGAAHAYCSHLPHLGVCLLLICLTWVSVCDFAVVVFTTSGHATNVQFMHLMGKQLSL